MYWFAHLGRAILAFAATNIDDIFVLTLFFAQRNLRHWHIVLGQYLGIAGLIAVSLVGFYARILIPHKWIGLLGLGPIAIGLKKLIDLKRGKTESEIQGGSASVFTVTTVTFANGGDNIAVYIPLFANSNVSALLITLSVFTVMIAIWCALGYYLGHHPATRRVVDRYGHVLAPLVLIALGIYIVLGSR